MDLQLYLQKNFEMYLHMLPSQTLFIFWDLYYYNILISLISLFCFHDAEKEVEWRWCKSFISSVSFSYYCFVESMLWCWYVISEWICSLLKNTDDYQVTFTIVLATISQIKLHHNIFLQEDHYDNEKNLTFKNVT